MKIIDIQCYPLRTDLHRAIGFSQWYYKAKSNLVLKITCEDGTIGWGECYGPNMAIAAAIEHHFKPLLLGKNALHNEVLWNLMWKAYLDFNRHGIFMAAISGLDIAFWDIKGKALQTPLRRLLGGSDDHIPCYATGMYYRDDKPEPEMLDELLEEAAGYLAQGYQFLKVKLGKNLAFDKQLIRRFRECFPETLLAGDANHAYNFKEALTIAKVLEANGYTWFEEPLSPEDLSGMARLRQVCSIPIAAGECEQTRFGFARLAEQESLDIFQPDLAYCGGITEFLKINGIASAAHVDLVPHCWGLKINQAAAAAAIAILPENPGRFECRPIYLEMDQTEHAVRDSIFTKAHVIKEGYLQFNDLPGLGVELDEAILQKFIMDSTNDAQARFAEVE